MMGRLAIHLSDSLREFVDEQVAQGGYGTSSEYVRDLIRRDHERLRMRALLLEGAESPVSGQADSEYFRGLRKRVTPAKPKRRRA
jgi:antitoxin ParD1/3/4